MQKTTSEGSSRWLGIRTSSVSSLMVLLVRSDNHSRVSGYSREVEGRQVEGVEYILGVVYVGCQSLS